MSAQPDDFNEVKRLLALKRHEQPSPKFFDQMSAHIREGLQHPPPEPHRSWLERLRTDLDLRAVVVGIVICGVMLGAILSAMRRDPLVVTVPNRIPIFIPTNVPVPIHAPVPRNVPALEPIENPGSVPGSLTPVPLPSADPRASNPAPWPAHR